MRPPRTLTEAAALIVEYDNAEPREQAALAREFRRLAVAASRGTPEARAGLRLLVHARRRAHLRFTVVR